MADAGRVIAGSARGVRLATPGPGTRPLADRVKQTLFAVLEPALYEAAVLDLFAGSGAAGIEALSRGATRAVFVEKDASAVRTIHENLRRTGLDGPAAEVVRVVQDLQRLVNITRVVIEQGAFDTSSLAAGRKSIISTASLSRPF